MGFPEGEERKKGAESLFKETVAENFLNLKRDMDIQVQETHRSLDSFNLKKSSPRHI